jgi:hypothetical protein
MLELLEISKYKNETTMKKVKNAVKKAFATYCNYMYQAYKPCIDAGVNPFI